MKHKKGDKVQIKSLEWYKENKDCDGCVYAELWFQPDMSEYCCKIATIADVMGTCYELDIDNGYWGWSDDMFEENVESKKEFATISKSDISK